MSVYRKLVNSNIRIRQGQFYDIDKNSNSCLKMSNLIIALNYFLLNTGGTLIPS